ncbi:Membrane protein involved in the export of O-antigen and teichoic acid [Butyrivibrio sp. ob235]|uniref:lipopolysaccharide biosynthesis protein n=1 Tax=Butyrivibrio sp. ob235 TaxID=1761780 RepID=UPI0008C2D381|nr:polysaccharide biosynthesis protein [Butyrivibrio sp. ob235]SEL72967.1 Membrane protein involved in the export of O-antigen and teichoic acid [Butyrivibrio sp. ob235]
MKFSRAKNASRNAFFGVILKVYQILIPFIMRTALVYFMGIQYLGLNSLFSSVLQVLNLAELGVGSAMVYSMYKPIAEDDKNKICALMNMYRRYYRIIGLIIAVIGLGVTPFIPKLIKGSIPAELSIYILYFLELGATVFSYWLFAYRNCLFYAHQRDDVNSKINICVSTFMYLGQILVLIYVKNYYVYIITTLVATIIRNLLTAYLSKKQFPEYVPRGALSKEETKIINKRIRDLFTSKLGFVIVGSADTIVISAFLGLEVLAIYQNYYFIVSAIMGIMTVVYNSCTAGIGNSLITETKEKNFEDLKKMTFLACWIACFCSTCFLVLFQPFMTVWMGTQRLLPFSIVICLAAYFFIYEVNQIMNIFKDAGGLWSADRFRPLVTALTNLGLNLIMVQFLGLYGVILSTVISTLFVGMPWLFNNLFNELFKKEQFPILFKEIFLFVIAGIIVSSTTYFICSLIPFKGVIEVLSKLILCIIIANSLLYFMFRKNEVFINVVMLLDRITKGRLRLTRKICRLEQ